MTDARNARRDRGLERMLREGLAPADPVDDAACLDADTIAAWIEGGLTTPERSAAESHAAGCARCQSMLAVMMRTAPVEEVPEVSAIRRWTMMLAPALAAAAAVALWFAVDRPRVPFTVATDQPASAVGEPPAVPAPGAPPPSPAEAPMTAAAQKEAELMLADALRKNEQSVKEEARASGEARPALRRAQEQEQKSLDKDAQTSMRAAGAIADARAARETASVAASSPPLTTAPSPPPARPAAAAPPQGLAETVSIDQTANAAKPGVERQRAEAPMQSATQYSQQQAAQARPDQQQSAAFGARDAKSAAEADRAAGRGGAAQPTEINALRSAAAKAADVFAFRSPDGNEWWRITGGRVAEASADKGTTWSTRYAADDKTSLTAGAAAAPSTVWVVGRAGAVIMTTDGRSWRRVPFPESIDLLAVTALDGRRATVITADGRSFTTADGGATWTRK